MNRRLPALLLALMLVLTACSSTSSRDLRRAAEGLYGPAVTHSGDRYEYASSNLSVSDAHRQMTAAHTPRNTVNRDGEVFLNYGSTTMRVLPAAAGSRLILDRTDSMRQRHTTIIPTSWGRTTSTSRSGGSSGSIFRGGGSGAGK